MFGRFFAARYFARRYFPGSVAEVVVLVPDPLLTLKNSVRRVRQVENIGRVRRLAARQRRQRILGVP